MSKHAHPDIASNSQSIIENQTLTSNILHKTGHGRTQSELPANLKILSSNFISSHKKIHNHKWESPLSEKEFDSSNDPHLHDDHDIISKSGPSETSNIKSKHNQVSTGKVGKHKLPERIIFQPKLSFKHSKKPIRDKPHNAVEDERDHSNQRVRLDTENSKKQTPFNNSDRQKDSLFDLNCPNSELKVQSYDIQPNEIRKNFLTESNEKECTTKMVTNNSDSQNVIGVSDGDIFHNKNVLSTHIGLFNVLSKNQKKDDLQLKPMWDQQGLEPISSPTFNKHDKTFDEHHDLDVFAIRNKLRNEKNCLKKASVKEIATTEERLDKLNPQASIDREKNTHDEVLLPLQTEYLKQKVANVRDVININSDIFDHTFVHSWQKPDASEHPNALDFINFNRRSSLRSLTRAQPTLTRSESSSSLNQKDMNCSS